jgi:hypothetical protein
LAKSHSISSKPTYWELLQHPRWQRKRLEVLEHANFECQDCGDTEKTLHVHHTYYEKGLKPWEYPDSSLQALCVDCHAKAQDLMTLLNRAISECGESMRLYGYAKGLAASLVTTVIDVLNYEMASGIGDAHGLTAEEIIDSLTERTIDSDALWRLAQRNRQ